jgi:hypothetical protein
MDNANNCDSYINTPSSQTYRTYEEEFLFSWECRRVVQKHAA